MICPDFTEASLRELLIEIVGRDAMFDTEEDRDARKIRNVLYPGVLTYRPIYLRFDIDADYQKAFRMSLLLNEYGINGTFFILNTADYWSGDIEHLFDCLKSMQARGHEIAWHNNVITELCKAYSYDTWSLNNAQYKIFMALDEFRNNGITIRGSASHGDPLCHKLGYINYEVFKECPRTQEAINFPKPSFTIPQVSMHDFGLEYEAYHVPYDLYLSESGGRGWNRKFTAEDLAAHDRIQILIHPQHWKI